MTGTPEDLLRGALEKIVFFECRVDQLEGEVRALRAQAGRARDEASEARRRESEVEARLAAARADADGARARAEELADRVRLLEEERRRLFSGLLEQAHLSSAPASPGAPAAEEADLAGFISELRAEIEVLSRWKVAAQAAGVVLAEAAPRHGAAAPAPVPTLAGGFARDGRLGVQAGDAAALAPSFATRSERALYLSSLEALSSPDPGERRRGAGCLKALGARAAAPLLAAALGREAEAPVKVALLGALGALGETAAAELVTRELSAERPAVRAAALDAAAALLGARALPALAAALGDGSPAVRRRAAMLLGFQGDERAEEALAGALADRDGGVARTAAVALAGRPSARAQGMLARALDHREDAVRRAAARAVERWSGERVDAAAAPAERRIVSRRIAERLHALSRAELRGAVTSAVEREPAPAPALSVARPLSSSKGPSGVEGSTRAAPPTSTPTRALPLTPALPVERAKPSPPAPAGAGERGSGVRAATAHPVLAGAIGSGARAATADPTLAEAIAVELRAALRGRSAAELANVLGRGPLEVEGALRALQARGEATPRGPRWFAA